MRQLFSDIAISLSSEVSVVFNISSSQVNSNVNTNLSNILFLHEKFLISKNSAILYVLLHS